MQRKLPLLMMSIALSGMAVPACGVEYGAAHDMKTEKCAKDCEMLLRNCANQVDTIQETIRKLQDRIKKEKAFSANPKKIRKLEQKLKDANETLKNIEYGR
jgi:peptidoglycan hydrolase CwlO-like protein